MVKNTFTERRKAQRTEHKLPFKLSHEDGEIVTETVNISRSGVYCRVNKFIEPMMRVKVNFLLPVKNGRKNASCRISCQGIVVRTELVSTEEDFYNIAIFFSEISSKNAEKIDAYVRACRA
jgi:hypothetical protein